MCDFGGTGTSLTLVDAANGYQAVAATVRHAGFSGDLVDQALLTQVVSDLSSAGSFDTSATSAIGSLTRLRTACRRAKEELSSTTVTTLTADMPGYRGDIRVTRTELDDAIRQSLDGFITIIQETLQRNGIRANDLAAIASVGGGASIPTVTTTLSEHLRVPVITTPRPHLTAAIGAALRAVRGPADDGETALAPTAAASVSDATTISGITTESQRAPALAWSEAGDDSGIMPIRPGEYPEQASDTALTSAPPPATVDNDTRSDVTSAVSEVWYRRLPVVMVGTALVVLALAAAVMIALRHTSGGAPSAPSPSVTTTPAPANQSPTPSATTGTEAPANSPPTSTESSTGTPRSTTAEQTTTTTTTQAPTTTTQAPTTTTQAPEPPYRRFPGPREFPRPEPGFR